MADIYTFGVSHVGQVSAMGHSRPTDTNANRIDQRTTVTVQANSLDEAKNKVRNSPEVTRNQQQAARRQNLEGQRQPRLVVNSIVKNPNTPNQQIIQETALQKEMRARENKQFIQKTGNFIKRENISPQQLFKDGLITYQDRLKLQKEMQNRAQRSPGLEGINIKSQPGGGKFTTTFGRFTGMKSPPKKLMNQGGVVTNNFKGTF